ncbi:MAG: adenylyltransferase/cytidyltransferase family protein [Planctomycetota bacterium]
MVVVPRKTRSKDKVFADYSSLSVVTRGLQSQGKTVVLSNGCFDLMHVGHMRCLEDARARGDFLVVAVNSDKSAETNKGKGYPIMPMEERMELLSGFWFVDYVTNFAEETAEELLRKMQPDFYVKGTDYNLSKLPEKAVLKELGIKAVFVGDKKNHSTRKIIQRIRKKKFA